MIERLLMPLQGFAQRLRGLPPLSDSVIALLTMATLLLSWGQWSTIYSGRGALPPIVVAVVFSVVIGIAVTRRTAGSSRSIPIGLAVGIVGCAAWYGTSSGELLGDLLSSWKTLASTGLLVPTSQEFVLVPVMVSWLAGWLAAEIIVRNKPIGAIVLPLAAANGAALAYTASQKEPSTWIVGLLGLLILVIFGISSSSQSSHHTSAAESIADANQATAIRWRQALISIPMAALVVCLGLGLGRLLFSDSHDPFDLRDHLVRPLDIYESTTPLSQVKAGLVGPEPSDLFTIAVDNMASDQTIDHITVATLDLYDGAIWTSSAKFERAGASLPAPGQPQLANGRQLIQTVRIETEYPFSFLPRVGQVVRSDSQQLGWDPRSGTIANVDQEQDSFSYTTRIQTSDPKLPTDSDLSEPIDALRYATALPKLNEDQQAVFQLLIDEAAAGATTEFEFLVQLESYLTSDVFSYNPEAPAGHSLAALSSYLSPDDGGSKIGFNEQSAATFAIAARQLGIPSRVVVGYLLEEPLTWENNRQVVSDNMIHAWPEIWFDGLGWAAFEPTNTDNETSDQTARTPAIGNDATAAPSSGLPGLQDPILIPEPKYDGPGKRRLIILGLVLLLPLLSALAILLAKRIRKTKRQRGDAAHRISGAWLHTRETLDSYGFDAAPTSTVIEIAENLNTEGHMAVAVPVAKMAPTVNSALFGPTFPSEQEADAMWAASDTALKEAATTVTKGRRVRAAVDPRVLLGR